MNRLGFKPNDISFKEILKISSNQKFDIEGIFTHFYDADNNQEHTEKQFETFLSFVNGLEDAGLKFAIKHCCNSAAAINYPNMQLDMVRIGASLYGIKVSYGVCVKEAMSLKAFVSQISNIAKGEIVSYGARFKADKDMKVATITAGYADGILRSNRNTLTVTINGVACKVLGTICMDQLVVDVSNVECGVDDIATIYGVGGLSINDVDTNNSTIAYEIMCDVGKRVKRIYK